VKRKQIQTATIVAAGLCLSLGQAFATSLAPGGTVLNPGALPGSLTPTSASTATSSTGSAPILEDGASWKTSSGGKTTTGANITFANGVWVDPNTGGLDFFYQIQNTYTGPTTANDTVNPTFTLVDYSGISITGVYQYNTSAAGNGCAFFGSPHCPPTTNGSGFLIPTTETVSSVSRSIDGSTLTVNLNSGVTPKTNSAILVIQTTAVDFDQSGSGTFHWNGAPPLLSTGSGPGQNTIGPWQLDALEPLVTPEPGFYGVLALGIAGLFLFVRRRSGKEQAKVNA
jgi:hypothetical protein